MKLTLRVFGIIGILLFGTAFGFTFGVPGFVEDIGKDFIKQRIADETNEKIESIKFQGKDSKLGKLAEKIYKRNENKINELKNSLKNKAHEKLADIIAEMRDLDCECRDKYAQKFKDGFHFRIFSLQKANVILMDFIKTQYMETVKKLKMDLRIFSGSNTLIFILLLLISLLKPRAIMHLFIPGVLLLISTIICSYFYLFEQNWFFTILYDTYLGWGYLIYLGVVFGFLCDVMFNKGQVTTEILNIIFEAIGSALTAGPC